ncbi:DNase I-like protein [Gonapodya prolifera JEL478]|uniref:DNA-(apurinic or apyrimidinic site) endonuclease n=1 Tax=Gonapodya prolifera (strain JEL478) TaxID=1344416 RepID=A0A139A4V8_GONPJ|nr:DNase I-like protein [Gonapodya prolifera JEL478]|eukprot:KXS11820.1 DNase I-like protein [Gonapodya prolifera JEL478]
MLDGRTKSGESNKNPPLPASSPLHRTLTILSWNVCGLSSQIRRLAFKTSTPLEPRRALREWFRKWGADVVCFQEAKVSERDLNDPSSAISQRVSVPGYDSFWSFSSSKSGYSGVTTYVRRGLSVAAEVGFRRAPVDREEGRSVTVDLGRFVLINIYVPNPNSTKRREYWAQFTQALQSRVVELTREGREVVVAGDWNTIPSSKDIYQKDTDTDSVYENEGKRSSVGAQFIHDLTSQADLVDPWRAANPDERNVFTYWDQYTGKRASNKGCRVSVLFPCSSASTSSPNPRAPYAPTKVDFFLISASLHTTLRPTSSILTTHDGSDHCPVTLTLAWRFEGSVTRTPGHPRPAMAWRPPEGADHTTDDEAGEEGDVPRDWHREISGMMRGVEEVHVGGGDGAGAVDIDALEEDARRKERDAARYKEALTLAQEEFEPVGAGRGGAGRGSKRRPR